MLVAAGVVGGLFGLVGGLIPVPLAGPAVASVGIGLASVFSLATLVGAYVQLAGGPERPVDAPLSTRRREGRRDEPKTNARHSTSASRIFSVGVSVSSATNPVFS